MDQDETAGQKDRTISRETQKEPKLNETRKITKERAADRKGIKQVKAIVDQMGIK